MHMRACAGDGTRRELAERSFGTLRASLSLSRARTTRSPLGGPREDHQLRDLLAHIWIVVRACFFRAFDHKIDPARALRIPFVRLVRGFEFFAFLGVDTSLA